MLCHMIINTIFNVLILNQYETIEYLRETCRNHTDTCMFCNYAKSFAFLHGTYFTSRITFFSPVDLLPTNRYNSWDNSTSEMRRQHLPHSHTPLTCIMLTYEFKAMIKGWKVSHSYWLVIDFNYLFLGHLLQGLDTCFENKTPCSQTVDGRLNEPKPSNLVTKLVNLSYVCNWLWNQYLNILFQYVYGNWLECITLTLTYTCI